MKKSTLLLISLVATLIIIFSGLSSLAAKETLKTNPDIPDPSVGMEETAQLPDGVSSNWWAKAQKEIQRSEYQITRQEKTLIDGLGPAWQAPNRAQNLRTYFTSDGIRVIPRTGDVPSWMWGLTLARWGYEGQTLPVESVEPSVSGNRVDYDRGNIIEWYINDQQGLEQGFTVPAPPHGKATETTLALELSLSGGLKANLQDGRISFTTANGGVRVIDFGKLKANDAKGRELSARFALSDGGFTVLVDAADAVYPLIIDPLAIVPSWAAESDQTDAGFGFSVSTAGDVNNDGFSDIIIGAPFYDNGESDEGRAFVYHGSTTGLSVTANWTAESNQAEAKFGFSVSTAGDVNNDGWDDVIIGAPYFDNGEEDEGRAFVYHGSATGLSVTANWTAESDQMGAEFGFSVAKAGDVDNDGFTDVIVGAPYFDNGEEDEGAAFVYNGSATGLNNTVDWMAESNYTATKFGFSVSTAGDVNGDSFSDIVIGAYHFGWGRAFVYHGSATGLGPNGTPVNADWEGQSGDNQDDFGRHVSSAGDVNGDGYDDVIVGAPWYNSGWGRVFVFYGRADGDGGLSNTADWFVNSDQAGAYFGNAVSTAGDVNNDGYDDIMIGAPYYSNGETEEGKALVYYGSPGGPSLTADWTCESDQGAAHFGASVFMAGDINGDGHDDIIIGAPNFSNGETEEGAAFIYYGLINGGLGPKGTPDNADWKVEFTQELAFFGFSVSTAGDVNGDGYDDIIIGAILFDNGQEDEGAVFVYHGSQGGLNTTPDWSGECNQQGCTFGMSVSTAGDVDGDGYDDIIIGAGRYSNEEYQEGGAFVYYGSAAGLGPDGTPENADWMAESNLVRNNFGMTVSTAGDVNGDGYDDVIIGNENFMDNEGIIYVYYGDESPTGLGPNGTPGNADWMARSNQTGSYFGTSVSTAGDVNGDGWDDIIIGASRFDNGEEDEGAAFVYHGSPTGLNWFNNRPSGNPTNANWTAEANQADAEFGRSVSTAGDVNNDGYDDVIIGAFLYDNGETNEGGAFVYYGSPVPDGLGPDGTPDSADWKFESNQEEGRSGTLVSTAGDVNGDGYDDVIILGGYGETNGSALVYYGSPVPVGLGTFGTPNNADWRAEGDPEGSNDFGFCLSTAGDVNQDGFDDIIIADYRCSKTALAAGAAFVYYGGPDSDNISQVAAQTQHMMFPQEYDSSWTDEGAAFRYTGELYQKETGGTVNLKEMGSLYDEEELERSLEAEAMVRQGLMFAPTDANLWDLLLDIYYHRTAAAQILAGELLSNIDGVQLGLTAFLPTDCNPPSPDIIDREICILELALEAYQLASMGEIDSSSTTSGSGYFHLLQNKLDVARPGLAPLGFEIFQSRVPERALEPLTYWDPDTLTRKHVGDSPVPLFTGYKDVVLLFGLLRDMGNVAERLANLYSAKGDIIEAENLITRTQSLLLAQGQILFNVFQTLETDADTDSGVNEAIALWRQTIRKLTTTAQLIRADKNPLGFDKDFLVFMAKPGGMEFDGLFDSFDLLETYLHPFDQPTKPLGNAMDELHTLQLSYEDYDATQVELSVQLESLSSKYDDRLIEIVGCSKLNPDPECDYDSAKEDPMNDASWGEVAQQLLSIEAAKLAIEKNRHEMDNLTKKIRIEVVRRAKTRGVQNAMEKLYVNYGSLQARLSEDIARIEAAQAASDAMANAVHGVGSNPFEAIFQIGLGASNAVLQAGLGYQKAELEGEKERMAAQAMADIVALESELDDIDSDAQIKTWLLETKVLAVDSLEAAILLAQELGRLKALLNEVNRLETGLAEANANLSRRYFADPVHQLRFAGDVRRALASFESAQHWIFYMARALEYKWNETFEKEWLGRTWTVDEIFRCRNADELYDAYVAMDEFDSDFAFSGQFPEKLSLRQDILGFFDGGLYEDPLNPGTMVDAITAFQNYLKSKSDSSGNLTIKFSTAREFPGTNLFLGPIFNNNGNLLIPGRFVDKIKKLMVSVVGDGASGQPQLYGSLTYGGTSFIRRQWAGQFDPSRPDKLMNELTTYSTRFWTKDMRPEAQKFVSQEAQTVTLDVLVNPDHVLDCLDSYVVGENTGLRERSVAASGWELFILNRDVGGVPELDFNHVDDIEIHICHRWKDQL